MAKDAGEALVLARHVGNPDAIVMLASHEWERLPEAAALARSYPQATVLLTEPREITEHNCHRCGERVAWLAAEGVDGSRIVVLPRRVVNTRDEALSAREYAAAHGVRRLAVVTSPYHTRRALATFDHAFAGTCTAIGVVPASDRSPARPRRWWWHLYDMSYVAYEWAALLEYRLRYGVRLDWPADAVGAS